jgi:tRNA (cmo5U34)-methyltransferase
MHADVEVRLAGEGISVANAAWSFSGKTAEVFPDHVRRSVPFYEEGHDLVCQLSDFFIGPSSLTYELGTSVGELLRKLALRHRHRSGCRWTGIDIEADMVERARAATRDLPNVSIEVDDIITCELEKADVIASYYCLQFIPPRHRQEVISKIYDALHWGGAFIWFEKVRGPDARFQDILSALYVDYKLERQYTPEEIVAKSRSLKGVLVPFSTQGNLDLLARAGFVDVMTVFRYLCFEGVVAIK